MSTHSFKWVGSVLLIFFRSLHLGRRSQVLTLPSSHTLTTLIFLLTISLTISEPDEFFCGIAVMSIPLSLYPVFLFAAFDIYWISSILINVQIPSRPKSYRSYLYTSSLSDLPKYLKLSTLTTSCRWPCTDTALPARAESQDQLDSTRIIRTG